MKAKKNTPKWQDIGAGMPHLREPAEESIDLYPGLVVCEARKTGSITAGRTGLPLWAIIPDLVQSGFAKMAEEWTLAGTHLTPEILSGFLYWLLEQRGDFARLLLVLADVERQAGEIEEKQRIDCAWWFHPEMKERVREALQRCLDSLEKE